MRFFSHHIGVASDVKCDGPEEEEVTKVLEVNSKADEPEQGEEGKICILLCILVLFVEFCIVCEQLLIRIRDYAGVSSIAAIESADKSCDNSKVKGAVEELTKPQEGEMIHFTHAFQNPTICSLIKILYCRISEFIKLILVLSLLFKTLHRGS